MTALLFSLIFKKADMNEGDEDEDEEELILKKDEEFLHPMPGDPGNGKMSVIHKIWCIYSYCL